jgi:hypothetical protein
VFDTKADSAFLLSRILRPESLKFLVLFSSAAGPFGNRGQCDYAAANEILNKLAIHLDKCWPGRVVSINWGPWAKAGMVSPELQRQFVEQGVQLIPIPVGCQMFDRELKYGQKGEVAIVAAGGAWAASEAAGRVVDWSHSPLPLLQRAKLSTRANGVIKAVRTLDPSYDLYLQDHQLDGRPVLPLAMAMELMAEVVQEGWPDLQVIGLRDLSVLRGVILEDGPKMVRLVARAQSGEPHDGPDVSVNVEVTDVEASGRPYYRATVESARALPEPPSYQFPIQDSFEPFQMTTDEAYRQWLFHGSLFQGIAEIQGVSENGMAAVCKPSLPDRCLAGEGLGHWLIDPVVLDSGLQLIILWARANSDMTPLPSRFTRYQRFGPLIGSAIRCHLQASTSLDGHNLHANLYFVGPDQRLLGVLEDLECSSSKALNRLAGDQGGNRG